MARVPVNNKILKHNRALLRMCGLDPRGLSATKIAKGAGILARLTRDNCSGGTPAKRAKAAAEWEAFFNTTNATPKPRTADRHREPNRDRHSPGYMRDYMRRRRAADRRAP
jgi:hypothetical protein